MKKIIATTIICGSLFFGSTKTYAESTTVRLLKEYGVPCALSLVAGLALSETTKNGAAIGVAFCSGIGAYGYFQEKKFQSNSFSQQETEQLNKIVADSMKKMGLEQEVKLNEKLKSINENGDELLKL